MDSRWGGTANSGRSLITSAKKRRFYAKYGRLFLFRYVDNSKDNNGKQIKQS